MTGFFSPGWQETQLHDMMKLSFSISNAVQTGILTEIMLLASLCMVFQQLTGLWPVVSGGSALRLNCDITRQHYQLYAAIHLKC